MCLDDDTRMSDYLLLFVFIYMRGGMIYQNEYALHFEGICEDFDSKMR